MKRTLFVISVAMHFSFLLVVTVLWQHAPAQSTNFASVNGELEHLYRVWRSSVIEKRDTSALPYFRSSIAFDIKNDSIWLDIFVSIRKDKLEGARESISGIGGMQIEEFGRQFLTRVNLARLPILDTLQIVENVSAISPDSYIRASRIKSIEKKK